jgi:hypothetical protein
MKTQVNFEYILNGEIQKTILEYKEPIYDVLIGTEFYRFVRNDEGKIVLLALLPETIQTELVKSIIQSIASRLNEIYTISR